MSDVQFMEVPNFALQRGGMLPLARLAYRTIGQLNAQNDNAILIPSWITGNDAESEAVMCGPDRALNPEKYFIIFTNHLGAGRSSSPSNTPAPCEQARFPTVTYLDNIKLQRMMVTERLGLSKLKLVTGISMGAAQTYQWASQFPDMVEAAVPIVGSARAAAFNRVFLYALKRALMLDPAFDDGFYSRPPVGGLKAFATIYAGWGVSEAFYREEAYRGAGARSFEEYIEVFWEPFFLKHDANNLLAQIRTWELGNIGDNPDYGGNFEAALAAIKARVVSITVDLDRYFPPVDADYAASKIPNGESRVVRSIWGHMAPFNPGDVPAFDAILASVLSG